MAELDQRPRRALLRAFETQIRETSFTTLMLRYAQVRARYVAACGGVVHEGYADELVQDVLEDTVTGRLTWNHEKVSLQKHVMDAIKSRSRHAAQHACRYQRVDLEHTEQGVAHAYERSSLVRVVGEVVSLVREVAAGDLPVLLLVAAYIEGASTPKEIAEATGLSSAEYDAARNRLDRISDQLPQQYRNILRAS